MGIATITSIYTTAERLQIQIIRILYGCIFTRGTFSVGYADAHPRLNPVGILPPGSRPSDVHSSDDIITFVAAISSRLFWRHYRGRCGGIIMVVAMTCEACEAETQARLIARGKRSATPGIHHPPPSGIRIGCELHNILGTILRPYNICVGG